MHAVARRLVRIPPRPECVDQFLASGRPAAYPAFNTGCIANCTVATCSCPLANSNWSSSALVSSTLNAWLVSFYGVPARVRARNPLPDRDAARGCRPVERQCAGTTSAATVDGCMRRFPCDRRLAKKEADAPFISSRGSCCSLGIRVDERARCRAGSSGYPDGLRRRVADGRLSRNRQDL